MTSFAEIFLSLAGDSENTSLSTIAILSYFFLDKNIVSSLIKEKYIHYF